MLQLGKILRVMTLGLSLASIPATASTSDIIWGANGHPFSAYDGLTISDQVDFLRDLGVRYYRVNVRNEGDAPALGKLISVSRSRGIKILPVVTPDFDLDKEKPKILYRKAYELARKLVGQFKEHVRVWELGNEMENYAIIRACEMQDDGVQYNCSWGPAGGTRVLDYYGPRWGKVSAVLKGLSDGVISIDPSIRKAIGTAGWGHLGAFSRMKSDGIQWDISVWHSYTPDMEVAFKFLSQFGHPIWLTEFNYSEGSKNGEARQSEGLRLMVRRIREMRQRYNVEAAFFYELFDEPYWAPNYEAVMGLVKLVKNRTGGGWRPGEPKQAYFTLKTMIQNWSSEKTVPASPKPKKRPVLPDTNRRISDIKGLRKGCELAQFHQFDSSHDNQVAYSFCLVLGRQPDGGGLGAWKASLKKGLAVTKMLALMVDSVEFAKTFKTKAMDEAAYTKFLYRLLLDRDPDGGEFLSRLAKVHSGATRQSFAETLVMSDELRRLHHVLFPDNKSSEESGDR